MSPKPPPIPVLYQFSSSKTGPAPKSLMSPLTVVPEEIVLLNLTYFDVGDNQITSLPDNLCDACTFDTVNQTDCMMVVYGNQK